MHLRFGWGTEAAAPMMPAEVGEVLGMDAEHVAAVVQREVKEVPLVGDPEPLEVLHEDESMIVVNKPSGVMCSPPHRLRGGSVVNRAIHYLVRYGYG